MEELSQEKSFTFFRERVAEALAKCFEQCDALTEEYLVHFLGQFVRYDPQHPIAHIPGELPLTATDIYRAPLVTLYRSNLGEYGAARYYATKSVAELSLLLAGLFPTYLALRAWGVEHYIHVGAAAYGQLSMSARHLHDHFYRTYCVLSHGNDFKVLVRVLNVISDRIWPADPERIMSIYVQCLKTQKPELLAWLRRQGVTLDPEGGRGS